jgi:hypothetical protein
MDQSAPSRHVQARGAVVVAQIGWGHLAKFARPGTLSSELRNPNSVSGRRGTGSRSGPTHRRDKTSCPWAYVSIRLMACFRAETSPNGVHRARWSHLDAYKSMRRAPMLAGSHRAPGSPVSPNLSDRLKSCSNAAAVGARVSCCPAIRRRWACHEVGTEAALGHGAAEALTGHVAQRPGACLLPPPAGAPLVCPQRRGQRAVQRCGGGPARRYRQRADQRRSAQARIYGVAKTCDGARWAGQRGAEWAFGDISEGLLGGPPPGQAHVVSGGVQVVARHVEARREDFVDSLSRGSAEGYLLGGNGALVALRSPPPITLPLA